jgi:hypothetical protein
VVRSPVRAALTVYLVGVAIGLWRADAKPMTRIALAVLWPIGPLAFVVTLLVLFAASPFAFIKR